MPKKVTKSVKPAKVVKAKKVYAGFFIRFGAFTIDFAFLNFLNFIFNPFFENNPIVIFISTILFFSYFAILTKIYGATFGKVLFGLKVLDADKEKPVSLTQSFSRAIFYIPSFIFFGLGILNIFFGGEKRRAWHDHLAHTVVVGGAFNKPRALLIFSLAFIINIIFSLASLGGAFIEYRSIYFETSRNSNYRNERSYRDFLDSHSVKENSINLKDLGFDFTDSLNALVALDCPNNLFSYSAGSGTIIDPLGVILTNAHVLNSPAAVCRVGFTNDITKKPDFIYHAELMNLDNGRSAFDQKLDLALLKITSTIDGNHKIPSKFGVIKNFGESDILKNNDSIYVAGYPSFGNNKVTFTEGAVSGRLGKDLIKVSAKIDEGNSGGAAFNEVGEFIGVPTFVFGGPAAGVGYVLGNSTINDWLTKIQN